MYKMWWRLRRNEKG